MSDKTSSRSTLSAQQENQTLKNNGPRRRLDHMPDLADGKDQFDMIPRRLTRAWLDKKFPEVKFRLLVCMMSHSGGFHVKRSYLQERFSNDALSKYLKELIAEGYLELEVMACPTGGTMKLYHVRSLEHWDLYSQTVDPPATVPRLTVPRLSEVHKESKGKETNQKENNQNRSSRETEPKEPKADDDDVKGIRERASACFQNDKGPWKAIENLIRKEIPKREDQIAWIEFVERTVIEDRKGELYSGRFSVINVQKLILKWKEEN